jgi:hypothetical protein
MIDENSGLPYYYHTKTGETVWERPAAAAFVIPLRVLQVSIQRPFSSVICLPPRVIFDCIAISSNQPITVSAKYLLTL